MLYNRRINPKFQPEQRRFLFGFDDLIGGAIGGVGSLIGGALGSGGGGDALAQKGTDTWSAINPTIDPSLYQYIAENPQIFYQLPEDIQATLIKEDPGLRAMQQESLDETKGIAEKGYTTAQQKAYSDARKLAEQTARGSEGALANQFAAQGRSGSGVELALRQMAQQAAQDRAAESMTTQAANEAAARQLANQQLLTNAGAVRGQDYTVNKANTDIINSFNTENSRRAQEVKNANVALQNAANQRATAEQRNVQNQQNQQRQQNINNQMQRAAGLTNQYSNQANREDAGAAAWGQTAKDIASGVAQAVGGSGSTPTTTPTGNTSNLGFNYGQGDNNNYWKTSGFPYAY